MQYSALYNEIDPYTAAWLRNLIAAGHIAPGVVDERSIEDLEPGYVGSFTQFHAFAGLGGWSLALRLAGVSDDTRLWTGSCPCQPFSAAGKGGGFADERHLWPAFDWLIGKCRPNRVFGEQVEGPAGRTWLDLVATDLEGHDYAFGTAVFPAAGVGAPQIRHRTYWVADSNGSRRKWRRTGQASDGRWTSRVELERLRDVGRVGTADAARLEGRDARPLGNECATAERGSSPSRLGNSDHERRSIDTLLWQEPKDHLEAAGSGEVVGMADPISERDEQVARGLGTSENIESSTGHQPSNPAENGCSISNPSPTNGFWRVADWLYCRDDKWRPVESGTFPLATGAAARVGRLRAYGNAICVPQAVVFVEAVVAA